MQMDGKQMAVVNSYDKRTTHYKLWPAEADIRDRAKYNKNAYLVGIFACCREIFNSKTHRGYLGGSELQAYVYFDNQAFDELRASAEAVPNRELQRRI